VYDLVVIGGGSGGLTIGKYGAKLGAKVAIVEAKRLGGDCTWVGCIPSKALIASARVAHLTRRTAEFGLPSAPAAAPVDLGSIADRIAALQAHIYQESDDPAHLRADGCDVIEGLARFLDPGAIEVDGRRIESRYFCIATGSSPVVPPIPGLDEVDYLTNHTVFQERVLPGRLLVIGGGPIGLELGQAFSRLGSQVTVAEALPRILTREDPDVSALLADCLQSEGIDIRTGTMVQALRSVDGRKRATLAPHNAPGNAPHSAPESAPDEVDFDAVIVAVGQKPLVEGLDLEAAGVEYTAAGIEVDATMRTSNRRIFAAGDVTGRFAFTHTAAHEASVVLRNALFPMNQKIDYSIVPWATFTDPEVARVGLTEAEARDRHGDSVQVYCHDFASIDRAILDGNTRGFIKLVTQGRKERIVGAQIIGPAAGELIHEFAVAMKAGMTASQLAETMHVYPTLSEISRYAALKPYERWLGSPMVQRLRRLNDRFSHVLPLGEFPRRGRNPLETPRGDQ